MGGPDTPGIGWAAGIERLILLSSIKEIKKKHIAIIPVGEENNNICINLTQKLRNQNIPADMAYSGNLKKRLKNANKLSSNFAIIIGTDEINNNNAIVRNLETDARSQLKRLLYDSFENHRCTMAWEDENGSWIEADAWWAETLKWLENVPLEKINPAIPFPGTPATVKQTK